MEHFICLQSYGAFGDAACQFLQLVAKYAANAVGQPDDEGSRLALQTYARWRRVLSVAAHRAHARLLLSRVDRAGPAPVPHGLAGEPLGVVLGTRLEAGEGWD